MAKRGPKPQYERVGSSKTGAPTLSTRLDPVVFQHIAAQAEGPRAYLERLVTEDARERATTGEGATGRVEEEGDWEFCHAIARGLFEFAERFNLEPFHRADWDPNFTLDLTSADLLAFAKRTRLWSLWEQIYSLYVSMNHIIIEALGFRDLTKRWPEKSPRNLGMKWRFQKEFENFVFRLFALIERMAQLSNIFHDVNLPLKKVGPDYWKDLKGKRNISDPFVNAIDDFIANEGVQHLLQLRKQMTHHFELDLVGIGWPSIEPSVDQDKRFIHLPLGAKYAGAVDAEQATLDLQRVYQAVVELLRKVEPIVMEVGNPGS